MDCRGRINQFFTRSIHYSDYRETIEVFGLSSCISQVKQSYSIGMISEVLLTRSSSFVTSLLKIDFGASLILTGSGML